MAIGLLCAGQGAQHVGMGRLFYENFPVVRDLFEQASDCLSLDFKKLCFEGPESELQLTHNTQPSILLVSYAMWSAISKNFEIPALSAAAGHSLGEYSAIVCAGGMSFTSAIKLVKARGEFMQQAVPVGEGTMVAVTGIEDEQVIALCQWVEENSGHRPLTPANFNAPGQVVASGSAKAAKWLLENYDAEKLGHKRKARLIPLKVSAPFHCELMKPAQEKMKLLLEDTEFRETAYPIVQNVTAEATSSPETLRANLIEQISSPVQWVQSVRKLHELGLKSFIELGPGKVLAGLVKKIDSTNLKTFNIETLDDLKTLEKDLTK
jgi:[acyl-carrier-protein] S-malonyltransferase